MSEIKFVMRIPPQTATAQEKGVKIEYINGKYVPRFFTTPRVRNARDNYVINLHRYAPDKPLKGAIGLRIVFHFKTQTKRGYKVTRPDLDNMEKLLIDAMTDVGFWHDDSQVAIKQTAKRWDAEDMVEVEVKELGIPII